MSFVQEYTIYFLQGSQLFISFRALGPSGNKQFEIPSGNKCVYSFTKTHDISCLFTYRMLSQSKTKEKFGSN